MFLWNTGNRVRKCFCLSGWIFLKVLTSCLLLGCFHTYSSYVLVQISWWIGRVRSPPDWFDFTQTKCRANLNLSTRSRQRAVTRSLVANHVVFCRWRKQSFLLVYVASFEVEQQNLQLIIWTLLHPSLIAVFTPVQTNCTNKKATPESELDLVVDYLNSLSQKLTWHAK